MFRLDSGVRSLEVVLAGAVTTSELPWTATWGDRGAPGLAPLASNTLAGTTSGTAAVTLVPAPPAGNVRRLLQLAIKNADSAAATVTVRFNDNGTTYTMFKYTLSVGDKVRYEDGDVVVADSAARTK